MKPEVLKSWSLEIDYSRAPCLGADQKARGLWERDCLIPGEIDLRTKFEKYLKIERKGDNSLLNKVKISRKESDKWFYSRVNKPQIGAKLMLKIELHL